MHDSLFMPVTGPQIARPNPDKQVDSIEYRKFDAESVNMLALTLMNSVAFRDPDFIIGGADDPYIKRWWLRRERNSGSVYLHQVIRDDDDRALHCHPWDSTSIVLSGTLREVMAGDPWPGQDHSFQPGESRLLKPGSITSRFAEDAHRLEVVEGPVWTLFITGRVRREWGFHCPNGWVHWEDFTNPTDKGQVGRGCGDA